LILKTLFAQSLSEDIRSGLGIKKQDAEQLFLFFKNCSLFRWSDANNDCEDRANAICILLDEWKIPNYKGWVFSGYVFKKTGYLKNLWKYHVAAAIPVIEDTGTAVYILDPATTNELMEVEEWAANVTDNPHSYYFIKPGKVYIFPKKIAKEPWYERNNRNYNWTIHGLSGINGVSSIGKAQLAFNKKKLLKTKQLFNELRKSKPSFL